LTDYRIASKYRIAKLKRDYTDIAERLENGELKVPLKPNLRQD
jgi:hypothetical protein